MTPLFHEIFAQLVLYFVLMLMVGAIILVVRFETLEAIKKCNTYPPNVIKFMFKSLVCLITSHLESNWEYIKDNSCMQIKKCRRCDITLDKQFFHEWDNWVKTGKNKEQRDCSRCKKYQEKEKLICDKCGGTRRVKKYESYNCSAGGCYNCGDVNCHVWYVGTEQETDNFVWESCDCEEGYITKILEFAGKYRSCPSCGNVKSGTAIYRCSKCNSIFCDDCQGPNSAKLAWEADCPQCQDSGLFTMSNMVKKLGHIT